MQIIRFSKSPAGPSVSFKKDGRTYRITRVRERECLEELKTLTIGSHTGDYFVYAAGFDRSSQAYRQASQSLDSWAQSQEAAS